MSAKNTRSKNQKKKTTKNTVDTDAAQSTKSESGDPSTSSIHETQPEHEQVTTNKLLRDLTEKWPTNFNLLAWALVYNQLYTCAFYGQTKTNINLSVQLGKYLSDNNCPDELLTNNGVTNMMNSFGTVDFIINKCREYGVLVTLTHLFFFSW